LDHAHSRYRFHGLLRETLERELQRAEPELAAQLHSRASAWLRDHGDVDGAIRHAIAADDEAGAENLLVTNLPGYLTTGRAAEVEAWLDRIGEAPVTASRPLAVTAGLSALALGDAERAKRWRVAAACALERPGTPQDARGLGVASAILEAMTARSGIGAMLDGAGQAYQMAPESSPWRPISALVRGTALYLSGERAAANELLEESGDLAASIQPAITAASLAHRAVIAAEEDDWEVAGDRAEAAVAIVLEHGLGDEPVSALVFAAAALAEARSGRPDEGKQSLRKATELLADLGGFVPWYGALTRILLGHASLWLADVVRARTLLAEASRIARKVPDAVIFSRWFDEAWEHIDTLAESSLVGPSALTIAELRVLRFLPSHRSFREIGSQLGVSANTVKTQAHAVYRKLGAASRSEAVTRARQAGLLGT
jgi:LuxR family maltose regulon positive regulatory protein